MHYSRLPTTRNVENGCTIRPVPHKLKAGICVLFALSGPGSTLFAQTPFAQTPAPAPPKILDRYVPAAFGDQSVEGILGERLKVNLEQRLLAGVDIGALLSGYQKRPGQQTWIGEHAGKFIDAATNTWAYSGNTVLRDKLDSTVHDLISTQLADGYLGTYLEADRWRNWDIWAHKYNLIGLLNYHGRTGDAGALAASRKVGNLLLKVYGDGPGQRDIVLNGKHVGMANTSVLEAMVALYRRTGDPAYLEFCRYIVRSWDHEKGPKVIHTLLATGSVLKVANNKAYEMLSDLVGLVDLYRMTGDQSLLRPVLLAWQDIRDKRLYLSGTTSWREHFQEDHLLRADDVDENAGVGEGCVTTTWMQLNLSLLRLTGQSKYADELERTTYNSLLAAQDPAKGTICYFVPLNGKKRYGEVSQGLPGVSCCTSSIPRALALIPAAVWGRRDKGIAVNLYVPGRATIELDAAGVATAVTLRSKTMFPIDGAVDLQVQVSSPARFPIYLRVPGWCRKYEATADGRRWTGTGGDYLEIDRTWHSGDSIQVRMEMATRTQSGAPSYPDHVALQRGPQLLAIDSALNPGTEIWLAGLVNPVPELKDARADLPRDWRGGQVYAIDGYRGNPAFGKVKCKLLVTPIADAGQTRGSEYRVWLQKP